MTGTEIEILDEQDEQLPALPSPTLFGTTDPTEVVAAAAKAAKPLADVVHAQKLSVRIGPSEHVRVEGWTLLGSMLGVFPICVWSRKIEGDGGGWEARVEARTRAGDLVGAAEAECLRSEKTWRNRDDYALRSMAQTRATSKALRQPLGFVMTLAGFNPTPAEEMPRDSAGDPQAVDGGMTPSPPVSAASLAAEGELPSPAGPPATVAQKKKLDVLVGQLRDGKHLVNADLYVAMGIDPDPYRDEDGIPHWSTLRELVSKEQASDLIERLEKYAEKMAEVESAA